MLQLFKMPLNVHMIWLVAT